MIEDVRALNQADRIVGLYKTLYCEQYGVQPMIKNEVEFQIFLKQKVMRWGESHVIELIKFYLRSSGANDWYLKKAHSSHTFMSEIETLNGLYGKSLPRQLNGPGWDPLIQFYSQCKNPTCKETTLIVCKGSEVGGRAYSQLCEPCKSGLKNKDVRELLSINPFYLPGHEGFYGTFQESLEQGRSQDPEFARVCLAFLYKKRAEKIPFVEFEKGCEVLDRAAALMAEGVDRQSVIEDTKRLLGLDSGQENL